MPRKKITGRNAGSSKGSGKTKKKASNRRQHGGRSAATGVGYEAKIASSIATKMLGGDSCLVWEGVSGGDVVAITMQEHEAVDDVVISLRGKHDPKVFISAKHRLRAIAMTENSPAFSEVVNSFVRQFLDLPTPQRRRSRFMWAVPSSAGARMTQDLQEVLNCFREDAGEDLTDFARRRPPKEQKALEELIKQIRRDWQLVAKQLPREGEICEFLRMVYVAVFDFGVGLHHERDAQETIRSILGIAPAKSGEVLEKLENHFQSANRKGLRTTTPSLRQLLAKAGLKLRPAAPFAADIDLVQRLTDRNLERLKDHTLLRFASAEVHLEREEELSAMVEAAKQGDFLLTGEPGCGKSGLLHPLAELLRREGIPVVLLLAEEVFGRDWKGAANLPGLTHPLDDVLAQWPDGSKGVLITDALDAVREVETQKLLRRLLQDVQQGSSNWTVVASVREFDLKHGRELREAFPGVGVEGHSSGEFTGVSHFHLPGLAEDNLDKLAAKAEEISPFITSARKNPKARAIHRSPFFLRLAAELLRAGVPPERLADWSNPVVLLRRFWETRVMGGAGASHRRVTLQTICRKMTQLRSMALSTQEVSLGASEFDALVELRSRGIFQSPILKHGSPVGEDELRFSHHLLHDYAIARSVIPSGAERFADYASRERLLPIFYRQSFLFALEELWDGQDGRDGFWQCALKMESVPELHGITRILAPILAAKRVDTFEDLYPLFTAVQLAKDNDSPAEKALRHMASGLQDAKIKAGASAWCTLAEKLSALLPGRPSVEAPVTHILARLNAICESLNAAQLIGVNLAARSALAHHVEKGVLQGWRFAAATAIEAICKTFSAAISQSESALISLLDPQRLAYFPHWDLFDLAHQIELLNSAGDNVVLALFDAAFSTEPNSGEWEHFGGAIVPMRIRSSDNWNSIHYSLAEYYESRNGQNASLMTDIACIAWNAAVRRRRSDEKVITSFQFCGAECQLIEDHGHLWGREHDHEEDRILSHFETLLDEWAGSGDTDALRLALDRIAARNRTSLVWAILLKTGAEYPGTLGRELEPLLAEPAFLIHTDYRFGATLLLAALHKAGDVQHRERLEKLVLELPQSALLGSDEADQPTPRQIEQAQEVLFGALDATLIALPVIREMRTVLEEQKQIPQNREPEPIRVTSRVISDEEMLASRGVREEDSGNETLSRLCESLEPFRAQEGAKFSTEVIEELWPILERCERAVREHRTSHAEMAEELWGHLVGACRNIARRAEWSPSDERWDTVRRILLAASTDLKPLATTDDTSIQDDWPTWSSPAPRLDAASALPILVFRVGVADKETTDALLRLSRDGSHALRFNMARRIANLESAAPELMWQLSDQFIRHEPRFSVLEMLISSLENLAPRWVEEVKSRLSQIAERAKRSAPDDSGIHKSLAHAFLFHYFLRRGDKEGKSHIKGLIAECENKRASNALHAQLHACRKGGWLTAGDAVSEGENEEKYRIRTWLFFRELLEAAQTKLRYQRTRCEQLDVAGQADSEEVKSAQESMRFTAQLVDGIAGQLYFASGALADKQNKEEDQLTEPQKLRFWEESKGLFRSLASEIHPHTAHQVVEALNHLLPCAPREVFLTASSAITSSSAAGYQYESIAVNDVVRLIQHALADYRQIFQQRDGTESDCLTALLNVLDIFVEAGWKEARQLTHRLEEIYR